MAIWILVCLYGLVPLRDTLDFCLLLDLSGWDIWVASWDVNHKQGHEECCKIRTLEFLRILLGKNVEKGIVKTLRIGRRRP